MNLGDLFDLRQGLRHAIPPGPARADLAGWLTLMTRLAERSPYPEARLHAVYEIAAARSSGAAELHGPPTPLIRQFINEVQHSDDPGLLFDASVLIQFCVTAAGLGHTGIPMAEATGWTPLLRATSTSCWNGTWTRTRGPACSTPPRTRRCSIDFAEPPPRAGGARHSRT